MNITSIKIHGRTDKNEAKSKEEAIKLFQEIVEETEFTKRLEDIVDNEEGGNNYIFEVEECKVKEGKPDGWYYMRLVYEPVVLIDR